MEQKIREYEKFISEKTQQKLDAKAKRELAELHRDTIKDFQHERTIHLNVTLFFSFLAVEFVLISMWCIMQFGFMIEFLPLHLVTLILVILTVFYIKHYYFLENHIQGLYKYNDQLAGFKDEPKKA